MEQQQIRIKLFMPIYIQNSCFQDLGWCTVDRIDDLGDCHCLLFYSGFEVGHDVVFLPFKEQDRRLIRLTKQSRA